VVTFQSSRIHHEGRGRERRYYYVYNNHERSRGKASGRKLLSPVMSETRGRRLLYLLIIIRRYDYYGNVDEYRTFLLTEAGPTSIT